MTGVYYYVVRMKGKDHGLMDNDNDDTENTFYYKNDKKLKILINRKYIIDQIN